MVMKMKIYIDIVIIENLIMNSIILYATAIILKLKINHIKIIISSIIRSTIFNYDIHISSSYIFKYIF